MTSACRPVLRNTSGFVYYVSIAGITGTRSAANADVSAAVARLKRHTDLPVAVGFGINTAEQAAAIAKVADAAVVGSALVNRIGAQVGADGSASPRAVTDTLALVRELAAGVRRARQ
jgi:tryptophan synthase alpha chain